MIKSICLKIESLIIDLEIDFLENRLRIEHPYWSVRAISRHFAPVRAERPRSRVESRTLRVPAIPLDRPGRILRAGKHWRYQIRRRAVVSRH